MQIELKNVGAILRVSGERLTGIGEVVGSIPTVFTKEAVIITITASFSAIYPQLFVCSTRFYSEALQLFLPCSRVFR